METFEKVSYASEVYADALNLMGKFESPADWPILRNALAPTYYSVKECERFFDEQAYYYGTQFVEEYERRNSEYQNH